MKYRYWLMLPLVIVAVVVGCQRPAAPDSQVNKEPNKSGKPTGNGHGNGNGKDKAHAGNPSVTPNKKDGILSGVVRWKGPLDSDAKAAPLKPADLLVSISGAKVPSNPVPRLQVDGKTKGVANVVVWLEKAPDQSLQMPAEPPKLDQREGDCHPHVLTVPKGVKLLLHCSDDRANFHATRAGNLEFEVDLTRGKQAERPLDNPGLIEVRSKLAPWLSAYVHVFGHNHYALTGPDGEFQLPAVPAGEYTVVLWHEGWRFQDRSQYNVSDPLERRVKVKLEKGQGAAIEWTLSGDEK
jgi:hypothetical protein